MSTSIFMQNASFTAIEHSSFENNWRNEVRVCICYLGDTLYNVIKNRRQLVKLEEWYNNCHFYHGGVGVVKVTLNDDTYLTTFLFQVPLLSASAILKRL